jgi:two-component system cell cycle response regulator
MNDVVTGAQILVVEDTEHSMQLMTYLLNAHQHTVIEAVTGEEAVELATAIVPDLVVMDLQLPGIDGFEAMTAIRSIPGREPVPFIAVTSFAMVGDRDRALQAGFHHYLTKPIDPESFVGEVNAWLPERLRGRDRGQPVSGPEPAPAAAPAGPVGNGGADILVLDDSRLNQTLLRSILEPCGYHVRIASTVQEAIVSVDAVSPDLVLSDLHVGPQSGVELLSHLRAVPILSVIPFAFLSATTDWQEPDGGGVDRAQLIRRPIEPSALLAEVKILLDKRVRS